MNDLEKFIMVYYPNRWNQPESTQEDDLVGPMTEGEEYHQMGHDFPAQDMDNEDVLPSWAFYMDEGH